jgi:rhamnulokinase
MSAFAAVDLGASSGRVIVGSVDDDHVHLREVSRFPNGPVRVGGSLHWDLTGLYRSVLEGLSAAGPLDGIGVDSWAVDYGLLDADGVLLDEPFHYRDARTNGVPERAFATIPAPALYARTGLQVQPFNTVFQLMAEQRLADARGLLLIPDLLGYWLTGVRAAEVTNASTTGLLDATTRTWAWDLVERLGIDPGLLPPLRDPGELLGHRGSVPVWTVGSHDTASAVVAVPATGTDFAYISCGTWSLVGLELDRPVLTEESRVANFTNEAGVDGTVRYLRNVMGLWVLQECLRTWGDADLVALLADAALLPALRTVVDIDSPTFLPPGDMPARIAAEAARTGQSPPQTRAETVRCILDSLALAYRRAVRQASSLAGRDVSVVHVVGGGVRNELLCQLTADATGLPVVAGPVEGAALGNVLVQARAAGVLSGSLADLRSVGARGLDLRRYEPGATGGPTDRRWAAAERRVEGP